MQACSQGRFFRGGAGPGPPKSEPFRLKIWTFSTSPLSHPTQTQFLAQFVAKKWTFLADLGVHCSLCTTNPTPKGLQVCRFYRPFQRSDVYSLTWQSC